MKRLILFFAFLAIVSGMNVSAQGIVIRGKWKMKNDDKPAFSNPAFNDADWIEHNSLRWIDFPRKTSNGVIWFRKSLVIPSSLKAEFEKTGALTLSMGKIDQPDQTYLNGKLIGSTESDDVSRNYLIAMEDILWDQENNIAIKFDGSFSSAIVPQLKAATSQNFFVCSSGLKNADPKAPILKKDLTYILSVTNKMKKAAAGLVKADFYDLYGKKIYSSNKQVTLAVGANSVGFPHNSPMPLLKISYTLSIPEYKYTIGWNGEFGYDNLVYHKVLPIVAYKADQNYLPADFDKQQIVGWLGEKIKVNTEKRLYNVDEKELLAGFINRPGSHEWIGEHIGKFLEAACNAYANINDPALKIQIDRSAQQLIAAQLSDGYLGTYPINSHWTSWDVWSHKYDLVGLLRYYELSGFKPALTACEKMADLLCKTFGDGPGQKDIIQAGAHIGMAATSVLDPMTDLYRFSGNKKYLDFCFYIVKSFDSPKGPRIISTLDSVGRVDKVANTKAYEMLSNIVGIAKLYRVTNDEKFLKSVLTAWNDIVANRLYITGTSSSWEHFNDDHILPAAVKDRMGEGCVTTTLVQFNYQLFSITGEIKYLDELERTVYNHLIGAENPQTGDVCYYNPLMGIKPYFSFIRCCVSSIPRGIAMIPLFANGMINQSPAFLFYQPGIYRTVLENKEKTTVEFITATDFPKHGNINITVNPSKSATFKVLFRKPYWAKDFTISVNSKIQASSSGLVAIERTWNKGVKVEVRFTIPVKVLDGNISYPGQIALQRGPQVLAFDQQLNKVDAKDVLLNVDSIQLEGAQSNVLPAGWGGTQAFQVNAEVNGKQEKIILVPYAEAGQTEGVISTWMKKKN